jgi:hypothetical protein
MFAHTTRHDTPHTHAHALRWRKRTSTAAWAVYRDLGRRARQRSRPGEEARRERGERRAGAADPAAEGRRAEEAGPATWGPAGAARGRPPARLFVLSK